ncbi:MAG: hypothetical protein KDE14_11025, partial [Rhodobacteraceae bacterium]|nr:hypothetical protein [Paracoccaceae bacterium]
QRKGIAGVYCRTCADKTAIKASMISWLAGWWAIPDGPRETVKAIVSNMRGGRRPAERNARLLLRQAKAFKARSEMELARACAEQALSFASNPELRRDIDNQLLSLSAYSARTIKDRWHEPGLAATVQVLPLAAVVGLIAMSVTLSADRSITATVKSWFKPAPVAETVSASSAPSAGRIYAIKNDSVALRTGPSADYNAVKTISKGTLVLATEADPGGTWLRVVLMDRTSGFLPLSALTPNIDVDALDALSEFDKPAAEGSTQDASEN